MLRLYGLPNIFLLLKQCDSYEAVLRINSVKQSLLLRLYLRRAIVR